MTDPLDRERHVRAMMLPEFGEAGQRAVQAAVLTVEASGLAAEVARGYLEAAELELQLLPQLVPPEAERDGPYRAAIRARRAHGLRVGQRDPEVERLQGELQSALAGLSPATAITTLERATPTLRAMLRAIARASPPPDPDGLSPAAREAIDVALFLGAWLTWLDEAGRERLLASIHGEGAVRRLGGPEEGGLFAEEACPGCGLPSLQPRATAARACPGCFGRWGAAAELPRAELACSGCGAPLVVPAGAREASCCACRATTQRSARTFEAERAFAAAWGTVELPQDFTPGLPVVDGEQRLARWLEGLARQCAWYGALVPSERLARLVERALPGGAHREALRARAAAEGDAALLALDAALAHAQQR